MLEGGMGNLRTAAISIKCYVLFLWLSEPRHYYHHL